MESTAGKRLQEWREFKGLSLTELFRLTGIKVTTLSTAEQPGGSNPSYDTIKKLLAAFPDLSADWLLLGTGPMLRNGRTLAQLPTIVPSALPTTPASPLRIDTTGEDTTYWRTIAADRLRENEFLKELLRAANGLNRPLDVDEPQAPGGVGKSAGSEFAAAYAAPAERLVVGGLRRYEAGMFVNHSGHKLAWVDAALRELPTTPATSLKLA